MASFSILHWIIVLAWLVGFILPLAIVLKKAGFNRAWALLALFPLLSIVPLWLLATGTWQASDE